MMDEISRLLGELRAGDRGAMDRLFDLVYPLLRNRAHRELGRGRPGETLGTTALVHEVYLKLTDNKQQSYENRVHFLAVAARAMRQIVVDTARRRIAAKRGGAAHPVSLDVNELPGPDRSGELVDLDEALTDLARQDERLARTVELRFFGGLSVEETAEVLGVSPRTVKRDWRTARALLHDQLKQPEP